MPSPAARPIWSKRNSTAAPSARMIAYCAGRDVVSRPPADRDLIDADIWTNRAHCRMLHARRIIDRPTLDRILAGLAAIEKRHQKGEFTLDPSLEDVHMNIERAVAASQGEAAAGVMHTARSRNDQSATDVRLWLRDRLLERAAALAGLIQVLARFAKQHSKTIAPGWTHGQPAMPTTLGHWAAAHAAALARDAQALRDLWPLINRSPLGAAASFGTSWPIDRKLTAKLMAFDGPQLNSLDCISTRWEAEARLGGALAIMMTHLSSLGADLIHLSSPPHALLRLSDAHVTGSSIMPNKRNPDFAEVTRARAQSVHALVANLLGVGRGALCGYNRDTQWSKYWIMDLLYEVGEAPELFADVIAGIQIDRPALSAAATAGFSLAADFADALATSRAIPFRRAYHVVAEAVSLDESHGWFRLETINTILAREKIAPLMTEKELATLGNATTAVPLRTSQGGPSAADVATQAAALARDAQSTQRWALKLQTQIEKARSHAANLA